MVGSYREVLADALDAADALMEHVQGRPLDHIQWTPPQLAFLQHPSRRRILRAGNQIGKTTVGLAEVVWWATGTHPYQRTIAPPIEIWIVCTTWPQSVAIMRKFWALCPRWAVRPGTRCEPRYGFGKDNPAVVFLNGSIVRFKTTNQGAEALAGATVHLVLVDEPTSEEVWRELDRRLMRTGGTMLGTLTPINRPVEYLRQLVRDDAVQEVHARLVPENLVPVGARGPLRLLDGTPMDAAWIAEQRRLVLPRFAPVVLDGEWETRTEGAVFSAFDPDRHVLRGATPNREYELRIGTDYGEGDFRDGSVLAGLFRPDDFPAVEFLGESISDGLTTPEQDAVGVLDMLDAAGGWTWADLAGAVGDKPTRSRRAGRKSNEDLSRALEAELRRRGRLQRREELFPAYRQAKTGAGGNDGSVWRGVEWLHRAMLRPGHFGVHERCEQLIEALTKWDGGEAHKDPIDMARYATWHYAMRGAQGASLYRPTLALA